MTKLQKVTLDDLAAVIADRVKGARPARSFPRIIPTPQPTLFDSITRASILGRIRRLQKMYRLQWLVEQATFNTPGLDSLEDQALSALLRDVERARECIVDGIGFDEVGLLNNLSIENSQDEWS